MHVKYFVQQHVTCATFLMKENVLQICCFASFVAGTKLVGYNRMRYLIESLADLDSQFKRLGGPGLFIFCGQPANIFRRMKEELGINRICYEQDCEPIWQKRDLEVEITCRELGVQTIEKVSHTLWDPKDIIRVNGGYAPLTYQMMLHTISVLGLPPRPVKDVDFEDVAFGRVSEALGTELGLLKSVSKYLLPENYYHQSIPFNRFQRQNTFRFILRKSSPKLRISGGAVRRRHLSSCRRD